MYSAVFLGVMSPYPTLEKVTAVQYNDRTYKSGIG